MKYSKERQTSNILHRSIELPRCRVRTHARICMRSVFSSCAVSQLSLRLPFPLLFLQGYLLLLLLSLPIYVRTCWDPPLPSPPLSSSRKTPREIFCGGCHSTWRGGRESPDAGSQLFPRKIRNRLAIWTINQEGWLEREGEGRGKKRGS